VVSGIQNSRTARGSCRWPVPAVLAITGAGCIAPSTDIVAVAATAFDDAAAESSGAVGGGASGEETPYQGPSAGDSGGSDASDATAPATPAPVVGQPDAWAGEAGDAGEPGSICSPSPTVDALTAPAVVTPVCLGSLASLAFSNALSSCGMVTPQGALTTDVPVGQVAGHASAAVNGDVGSAQLVSIEGDLTVTGTGGLSVAGSVEVSGNLSLAGGGAVAGPLRVGGDAWLGQTLSAVGLATVGDDLTLSPGASLSVLGVESISGTTSTAPFAIAPPAACASSQLIAIDDLVAAARSANDDASIALASGALAAPSVPVSVTLPCGVFYVDGIGPSAGVAIRVTQRAALFVGGDVIGSQSLAVTLAPGAELDLFIQGDLAIAPGAPIGDPTRPGATRVFVQGSAAIALPGTTSFAASLYAPNAGVTVGAPGDVYGALFAASVSGTGGLAVHYDPSVASDPVSCPASP
jgi:hypothetical protein